MQARHRNGRQNAARQEAGDPHLWHIRNALALSFSVAVLGLAGLCWLAWALLGAAGLRRHLALHDAIGVLQLVFASVAGAGALVALVVAYRRQKIAEADSAHDRTRVLNERFTAIAAQFGEVNAAVRLAGLHAMAGLADDWAENRQTCIDVLCAYLRMPYEPDPGDQADQATRLEFRAEQQVRHSAVRLIADHVRPGARTPWSGMDFDLTGAVFDGGVYDFRRAQFSGGVVRFNGATFTGGCQFDFFGAEFSGGLVGFYDAEFSRGLANFYGATFSGGEVGFDRATFSGGLVNFNTARFSGGAVSFYHATFSGDVRFTGAAFSGSEVSFDGAQFSGGSISFYGTTFSGGDVSFSGATFSGGLVSFDDATFSGGEVSFNEATFSGGTVNLRRAAFSGGEVSFDEATFSGGAVRFNEARDWSTPPKFDFRKKTAPPGVEFPESASPSLGAPLAQDH